MTSLFFRRFRGGLIAAPTADLSVTIRSTETQLVDLSALLADFADEGNRITVTVDGAVPCAPWPWESQRRVVDGLPKTFVKRALQDCVAAITSATSEGASCTWTLSGYAGANGTGGAVTKTVEITVDDSAPTTWTIGQRTLAQHGGYPIHRFLDGTPGDWSIQSQSTSGALTIVNADNATASLATKRYVAWAGTYGSTTRTVGTPTAGTAAYTVTLVNSSTAATHTISFTVNEDELNCAPNPLNDNPSGYASQLGSALGTSSLAKYGDRIILEGDMTKGSTNGRVIMAVPGVRAGGPDSPGTDGYPTTAGWDSVAAAVNPGWITVTSREPGLYSPGGIDIDARSLSSVSYEVAVRFYLCDLSGSNRSAIFGNYFGGGTFNWCMYDHCKASGISLGTGADDAGVARFIWDCWFVDSIGEMVIRGRDSQVVGNWSYRGAGDFCKFSWYDTSHGTGVTRCRFMWNSVTDQKRTSGVHPDFVQPDFRNWTVYSGLAASATVDLGLFIGNAMWKGEGELAELADGTNWGGSAVSAGEVGQALSDNQNYFMNSEIGWNGPNRPDILHKLVLAGNLNVTATQQGIQLCQLASGTVIANNTLSWDWGITHDYVNGSGYYAAGPFRFDTVANNPTNNGIFDNNSNPSSTTGIIISRNVFSNSAVISYTGATTADNVNVGISGNGGSAALTTANATWVEPTLGATARDLADVVAGWAAKPGGSLWNGSVLIGAMGDPVNYIDHERRTYDDTKLLVA